MGIMRSGIVDVTNASVREVIDALDMLDVAYEAFDLWLNKQDFSLAERFFAQRVFDGRFSTGGKNTRLTLSGENLTEEQEKQVEEKVKEFVVSNGFMSANEFDDC